MLDLVLVMLPNPELTQPKMYYSLGILQLTAIAQEAGFSVAVLDMRAEYQPIPEAKFYGFSATTPEIAYAKKLAKMVKGKTIVGGAHATLMPQDCIGHFDYTVVGEGEEAILEILNRQAPYSVVVGRRLKELDKYPFPAWDSLPGLFSDSLFPGEKYGTGYPAATLISSRGCPWNCAFCANLNHAPVIHRSVDNITAEIKELIKRDIHYFRFEDDNVAIHPRFAELASRLKELKIHYKCHIRSDLITAERAKLLKESGCEECGMGIESADEVVLELNNKRETVADHLKGIRLLKEAGIRAKTYWVMGLPGETNRTLELNKQFVREAKPEKWTVSTFTPYPGCSIFKRPGDYGIEIIDWDFNHWWNFCEGANRYNHLIKGQTMDEMWNRYLDFYAYLRSGEWQ